MALTQTQVSQLYVSIFGRASEGDGNTFWQATADMTTAANTMLATDAAKTYFGTSLDTDQAFIESIYLNTLNKTATDDAAGIKYWVDALAAGQTRGEVVSALVYAVGQYSTSTDTATKAAYDQFTNRVAVSDYMATTVSTAPADYATSTAFKAGGLVVTSDAATVTAAKGTIDANALPAGAFAFTTATTDIIIGTAGNDTITGALATFQTGDMVIDQSSVDNDTINITGLASVAVTPTLSKIENVNLGFSIAAASTADVNAVNFSGVENLTINRADLADGAIDGAGVATVINVDSSKVAKITAGNQVTTLNVTQTKAGATVDASVVTAAVTINGAATVSANLATGIVAVQGIGTAAEDAKAVVVDAAKAATVNIGTGTTLTGAVTVNAAAATTVAVGTGAYTATGAININAAKATTITVANAAAGATIVADKGATAGITVSGIDDSGASVTTGAYTSLAAGTVTLGGTASSTDTATVSAAGFINLTTNNVAQIENLSLSGNGAAATYAITGAPTTTTLTGNQSVSVAIAAADITGKTLTDLTTAGTTTLKLTGAAGAANLTKVSVDAINMSVDNTGSAVTVKSGADVTASISQAGTQILAGSDNATITLHTSGTGTIVLGAIDMYDTATTDFSSISLVAGAVTTATTADFTNATVGISGAKNVTFSGAVTAAAIDASALTGNLSIGVAATDAVVTSGSGDDSLTLTGAGVYTVNAGNGTNTITITGAGVGTTVTSGSGDDIVNLTEVNGVVISTGSGNDTVNVAAAADIDAVINAGAGTADKLVFGVGATDLSDNTNFGFAGFETVDVTAVNAAITISNAQYNAQTFTLKGDTAADTLIVKGTASSDTINVSGITTSGGATLTVQGGAGADHMTGSASGTTFLFTAASEAAAGETISGGAGIDTISFTGATSFDLSTETITGVENLVANLVAGNTLTLAQGTGITSITGFADATANTFVLAGSFTTAAASAAAVAAAGQYFFVDSAVAGTADALTYWDSSLGQAQTITLVGTESVATNDTLAVVAGNLVISIA